ncbi:DoxX family protein [Catenuloplanes indicus]|uniref:DoxX family protein n=1 Tax=Catenuloplanes indicus TaxID=137267 RepID=A0AAE3VVQ6_9ACTN|nr:DoxX family protein [Catenuloplanes indicus]MDQ0363850.1 hypothetical protein [Catenuloplanes indicus]
MRIVYWILAALLAAFYVYAGGVKVVQSQEALLPMMAWVAQTPMPLVRTIGVLELLGAAGLLLPPLTGILPRLAVAAAAGLSLIQVGGIITHLSRGEAGDIGLNIVLLLASAVTAWLAATHLGTGARNGAARGIAAVVLLAGGLAGADLARDDPAAASAAPGAPHPQASWRDRTPMPQARAEVGVAAPDGRVYVAGGTVQQGDAEPVYASTLVTSYDLRTGR